MAPPTACNRSEGPAVEPAPVRPRHVVDAFGSVSYPRIPLRRPALHSLSLIHILERLAAHPNIMGIKEASGNVAYAAKIAHLLSDDFRMYSGEDALTVPCLLYTSRCV